MNYLCAKAVGALHERLVFGRRVAVLSRWFSKLLEQGARVLDVGCGDGKISYTLQRLRPDVSISGTDVLAREQAVIRVKIFDGSRLPFADASFDVVLMSDVLHHSLDPLVVLKEARRVAVHAVLIKDHYCKGFAAAWRLRLMDWVGNARFGVALPYNYWAEDEWQTAWQHTGLRPDQIITRLALYPWPVSSILDANLHFIALLRKCDPLS